MSADVKKATINDFASKSLGSENSYAVYTDKYDPSLLVAMPRNLARQDWGIEQVLGIDIWHCYEATFLLNNGFPVSGILKFIYSSTSEYMVESKSMKLYLNTYDMCKLGNTVLEASNNYCDLIRLHLSQCLSLLPSDVKVGFFLPEQSIAFNEYNNEDFIDLNRLVPIEKLDPVTDYKSNSTHLRTIPCTTPLGVSGSHNERLYKSHVLRSRCRHTKQKDTGSMFVTIHTVPDVEVDPESLLRQIVSLREQNEFHEFCCEKLYTEIMSLGGVIGCKIALLYTRRGSLDINPIRVSDQCFLGGSFEDHLQLTTMTRFQ